MPGLSLEKQLSAGETVFAAWCGMGVPLVAELLAREGFGAVVLDQQHGFYDFATTAAGIVAVVSAGAAPVVRIPVEEPQTASRLLDAGAEAVIAPMINSAADARRLVSFTKFPPAGARSWGPHGATRLFGIDQLSYLSAANSATLTLCMVETGAALAAIDDILGVDGVDGVFVGPSDLSLALTGGRLAPEGPEVDAALDRIAARAAAAGKLAGVFCAGPDRANALAGRGFRFLTIGTDSMQLRAGARAALAPVGR